MGDSGHEKEGVDESSGGGVRKAFSLPHGGAADAGGQEFMEERYWNSAESIFKERTARPNRLATWVNQAWTWDSNLLLDDIRVERNMRLFHSDWTVFTDSPLSDSEKTEAQTYRAALRNFPSTVDMSSVTSVSDAPWPTKPSFISE